MSIYKLVTCLMCLLISLFTCKKIINLTEYCDLKCKDGSINTVCDREDLDCGIGTECGEHSDTAPLSDEDRIAVLDIYNTIRDEWAWYENISNMYAFSYSKELEFSAQCLANSCKNDSDHCRRTPQFDSVGQVLYLKENLPKTLQMLKDTIMELPPGNKTDQILNPQVRYVGCGRSIWENYIWIVCNFSPDFADLNVIKWLDMSTKYGFPCASCENDTECNSNYRRLCGEDLVIDDEFEGPFCLDANCFKWNRIYIIFIALHFIVK